MAASYSRTGTLALLVFGISFSTVAAQIPRTATVLPSGQIDTSTSRVYALVGKTGLGHEHGVVGLIQSGQLKIGAKQDAGVIVFDMTTFTADSADARAYVGLAGATSLSSQKQVTDNMRSAGVLDVQRHPTATFAITSAELTGNKSRAGKPLVKLDGKFTLHGVTQPLSLVAEIYELPERIRLRGGFTILQTEFGITPYTKAFGAVGVANQLTIYGDILVAK